MSATVVAVSSRKLREQNPALGAVRRSALSSERAADFAAVQPFSYFGQWEQAIPVARPGTDFQLVKWMALNRARSVSDARRWSDCVQANRECFEFFPVVRLYRPSFFLPAEPVAFQVIENPTTIPDNPPHGVSMRHHEALDNMPPGTKFYFLRPAFTARNGRLEIYTGAHAAHDAHWDQSDIVFMSKAYGWAIRSAAFGWQRVVDIKNLAALGVSQIRKACRAANEHFERRRIRSAAQALDLFDVETMQALKSRAEELGMRTEAAAFRRAMSRSWRSRRRFWDSPLSRRDAALLRHIRGATPIVRQRPRPDDSLDTQLRRAFQRIANLTHYDPVLCFELPHEPGRLYLEAHWYVGTDGKTYVHY